MLNENFKKYRKKAGYSTVKEFSEKIGMPYTTYLSYEKGVKEPSGSNIIKIADKLGITTDELLGVKQDNTRYFKQAGYDVEEKEGVLYFSSRWLVTEDTPPHTFSMNKYEYDKVVEALEDNHKKNTVDVIVAIVRAREVKEDFEVLEDERQE